MCRRRPGRVADEVRKIVLMRHGKPRIGTSGRVSASGFGEWVSQYDSAGIETERRPADEALERARGCSFIVCSTLPRSVESAKALGVEAIDLVSHLFRECGMPYGNWKHPKLSKSLWSVLFRTMQLVGYSSNAESFKAMKERARKCTSQLEELAREHKSVLFVGHGIMNRFIHGRLLRMGWSGPRGAARKHWEFGVYTQIHC